MIEINCDTGEVVRVESDSLVGANLRSANLHRAQIDDLDISRADLTSTDLRSASLENTTACVTIFEKASLIAVWAKDANFSNANLHECRMICGNFENAIFVDADLTKATLDQANLCGCDFSGSDLTGASFDSCKYDDSTLWPVDFIAPTTS